MTQKFKTGDKVGHKSGGPVMVVKNYEPKDGEEVTCEWFDDKKMIQERSFHQDTLTAYEPSTSTFFHRPFFE